MKQNMIFGLLVILFTLSACTSGTSQPVPTITSTAARAMQSPTEEPTMKPSPTKTGTSVPLKTPAPQDQHAYDQNRRLGRGVNLGNALEAPSEGEWGVMLEESFFKLIADAGFKSIRIPIRWNAHADATPPYTVDPQFFFRVDWAVEQALKNDLAVVVNIHHYNELIEQPQEQRERFLALWDQIAVHYKDYPDTLFFELLNEPNGPLNSDLLNPLTADAIQVIRSSNPTRTLIAGPAEWFSLNQLASLKLPEGDRNLIVSFHYYQPFQFTHQGAEWVNGSNDWLGTDWEGLFFEKDVLIADLDMALEWSKKNNRPLYLGEFGAYSKADMLSRVRWTEFIARESEKRGFSWAYWEFCAGFGVYDRAASGWNEPILKALIP